MVQTSRQIRKVLKQKFVMNANLPLRNCWKVTAHLTQKTSVTAQWCSNRNIIVNLLNLFIAVDKYRKKIYKIINIKEQKCSRRRHGIQETSFPPNLYCECKRFRWECKVCCMYWCCSRTISIYEPIVFAGHFAQNHKTNIFLQIHKKSIKLFYPIWL